MSVVSTCEQDVQPFSVARASVSTPEPSEKDIRRRVIRLAAPVAAEYWLQTGVTAINTVMVARLGGDALAGVGIATPIVFFLIALFSAISIGATVLVSNAIGAKDLDRANRLARQSLSWGLLLAVPISLACYALAPFAVEHFGNDHEVQAIGIEYLQIVGGMGFVMLISYLCGAVLRGAGDGKTPLTAAIIANIINVIACFLLITGRFGFPDMGIAGAAWASVLGRAVGAIFLLVVLIDGRRAINIRGRQGWKPERKSGAQMFHLGIPAAVEQISNEGGFIVLTAISASVGAAALTAHQIGLTAMDLWFMPGFAFAVTATSLVGQSVGAKKIREGVIASRFATRIGLVWMAGGAVLFIFATSPILAIFTSDPEVISNGTNAMKIVGLSLPFWGLATCSAGTLRGSGDTRSPMMRGIMMTWVTVIIAWAGVHFFDQGVAWIWGAYMFTLPFQTLGNRRAFTARANQLDREWKAESVRA